MRSQVKVINAVSIEGIFREFWGDNYAPDPAGLYNFKVRLVVPRFLSPRNEQFKLFLTKPETITSILKGENLGQNKLTLVFPEMWLNPLESHYFMSILHEEHVYLTHLQMITNSPNLLTNFFDNMLIVYDWIPDHYEKSYVKPDREIVRMLA